MTSSRSATQKSCPIPDELSSASTSSLSPNAQNLVAIIPAYNESLVIGSVVLQTRLYVDRVIVINDCSTDNTADIAELACADVVNMSENCGKASAMMAGFNRAKELGYEYIVVLDGDGQHNPHEIPVVTAPVFSGKADLVIGSRFLKNKSDIPKYRVAGQKVLNGFTNLCSGCPVTDSQSGYRALNKKAIDNCDFETANYNIESDMITHFANLGLVISEVPISVSYNVPHKHKKNPLSHGLGVLGNIVGIIGYKRPLLAFGIPGIIFTILGVGAEIFTFSQYVQYNQFHFILFTAGFSILILGLLFMMCGLILNSLVIIMKEPRDL